MRNPAVPLGCMGWRENTSCMASSLCAALTVKKLSSMASNWHLTSGVVDYTKLNNFVATYRHQLVSSCVMISELRRNKNVVNERGETKEGTESTVSLTILLTARKRPAIWIYTLVLWGTVSTCQLPTSSLCAVEARIGPCSIVLSGWKGWKGVGPWPARRWLVGPVGTPMALCAV